MPKPEVKILVSVDVLEALLEGFGNDYTPPTILDIYIENAPKLRAKIDTARAVR